MVGVDTPPAATPTAAGTDEVEDETEGDSRGATAFILQLKRLIFVDAIFIVETKEVVTSRELSQKFYGKQDPFRR